MYGCIPTLIWMGSAVAPAGAGGAGTGTQAASIRHRQAARTRLFCKRGLAVSLFTRFILLLAGLPRHQAPCQKTKQKIARQPETGDYQ